MPVRTNKVKWTVNHEKVAQDFEVCCVSYKKIKEMLPAYSARLLDYHILSNFRYDTKERYNLYLLGKRGEVNWPGYFKMLKAAMPKDMIQIPFRIEAKSTENDYILVNLLCNNMHNMNHAGKVPIYGNYFGYLLDSPVPYEPVKGKSSRKVNFNTLLYKRIHITRENTVYVAVESWMPIEFSLDKEKRDYKKYKYRRVMERDLFDRVLSPVPVQEVRNRFKKWKAGNKEDYKSLFANWYVQGTPNHNTKNTEPFMHVSTELNMDDKLNTFLRLLYNIKNNLHEYMTMVPLSTEVSPIQITSKKQAKDDIKGYMQQAVARINDVGLTLLFGDTVQREEALKIKHELMKNKEYFAGISEDKIQIVPLYSEYDTSSWSMQILYDKSKYIDEETHRYNEKNDEYDPLIMQHYSVDQKGGLCTKLIVCLMELLIKDSLISKRLPEKMHPHTDVTVVKSYPYYDENGDRKVEYYMLSISPSGQITKMSHFKETDMVPGDEEDDIQTKYYDLDIMLQGVKTLHPVEGLIKFGDGEYNAILRTTERPIPDYEKMMDHFENKMLHPGTISKKQALAYMRQYAEGNSKFSAVVAGVEEDFKKDDNPEVDIAHWRDIMKHIAKENHTKINPLTKIVKEDTDGEIYLQLPIKSQDNEYEMDHLTGISYRESPHGYDYYVGYRALASIHESVALDRSVLFRTVENDGSYTFDEFAKLLDVCWVRAGGQEPTVLPYPFKYLSEYKKMVENERREKRLSQSH